MHQPASATAPSTVSSISRTNLQYASHASQAAPVLIPLLVLFLVSIAWLVRTYGAIMANYLAHLPRIFLDLAQLTICDACLFNVAVYANRARLDLQRPQMGFLSSFATVLDFLLIATGFLFWSVVAIYAIEIFASRKRPESWSKVWELEPFAGLRSLLARQTTVKAAASTPSTRDPTISNDKDDKTNEGAASSNDTGDTPESSPDESPLSDEPSALSAMGHTELLGWQSVSKA